MLGTLGTTPYVIYCGRKQLAREFRENWLGEKVAMYLRDMKSFFSFWFAPNFRISFSRNDFEMADFVIEGHVCECMLVYSYFHDNIW